MNKYFLSTALGLVTASTAFAGNILDIDGPTIDFSNDINWTLGFAFRVNTPITINGLSIYDDQKNGLTTSHAAGLWTSSGTLLTSTVIPAGTVAPLDGWFRVWGTAPVTLGVGDYVVGARTENELYTWDPTSYSTISEITYLEDRFISDPSLQMPTVSSGLVGWFGGNAAFSVVNTPDTGSTVALLSGACLALAAVRRKLA